MLKKRRRDCIYLFTFDLLCLSPFCLIFKRPPICGGEIGFRDLGLNIERSWWTQKCIFFSHGGCVDRFLILGASSQVFDKKYLFLNCGYKPFLFSSQECQTLIFGGIIIISELLVRFKFSWNWTLMVSLVISFWQSFGGKLTILSVACFLEDFFGYLWLFGKNIKGWRQQMKSLIIFGFWFSRSWCFVFIFFIFLFFKRVLYSSNVEPPSFPNLLF